MITKTTNWNNKKCNIYSNPFGQNVFHIANAYPPIPDLWGFTSPAHRRVVTVASTAFPPLSSTASPRSEQVPTSEATAPDAPTYR